VETIEPWLRGTLSDIDAVRRQVLHALEQAGEDVPRWCGGLDDAGINMRPHGLPPVAFHLRHIARSLDRLLTYATGHQLKPQQHALLESELAQGADSADVLAECQAALKQAMNTIRKMDEETYEEPRAVGREQLPTTVGGLLVHIAEHTQRHIGQAITTAKIVIAMSTGAP
jgi:uncharacterized damage-inducible protein DinB